MSAAAKEQEEEAEQQLQKAEKQISDLLDKLEAKEKQSLFDRDRLEELESEKTILAQESKLSKQESKAKIDTLSFKLEEAKEKAEEVSLWRKFFWGPVKHLTLFCFALLPHGWQEAKSLQAELARLVEERKKMLATAEQQQVTQTFLVQAGGHVVLSPQVA